MGITRDVDLNISYKDYPATIKAAGKNGWGAAEKPPAEKPVEPTAKELVLSLFKLKKSVERCEAYFKYSALEITVEAQQLAATVELRQKSETAEFMRRSLERAERHNIALDELE